MKKPFHLQRRSWQIVHVGWYSSKGNNTLCGLGMQRTSAHVWLGIDTHFVHNYYRAQQSITNTAHVAAATLYNANTGDEHTGLQGQRVPRGGGASYSAGTSCSEECSPEPCLPDGERRSLSQVLPHWILRPTHWLPFFGYPTLEHKEKCTEYF